MDEIEKVDCMCGASRRAFLNDPDRVMSLHVVDIRTDSKVHYHKQITEIYYVLEGEGHMELDGDQIPVRPGSTILIKPGCRHRAVGQLKVIVVPAPAFDAHDEWFD
jgi:mannose-6-phosphate isomerase-like protein (cupin superfamily)